MLLQVRKRIDSVKDGIERRLDGREHFLRMDDPLVGVLPAFNRAIDDPHHGRQDDKG